MKDGFFRVPRSVWDDPYFNETHRYSKREAWFDLVRLARGVANGIERSQFQVSNVELAKRWSWPEVSVREFLANRVRSGWLRLIQPGDRASHRPAIYSVVNFDDNYNGKKTKTVANPEPTLFCDGSRDGVRGRETTMAVDLSPPAAMVSAMGPAIYKEERTEENVKENESTSSLSSKARSQSTADDASITIQAIAKHYRIPVNVAAAAYYTAQIRHALVKPDDPIHSLNFYDRSVAEARAGPEPQALYVEKYLPTKLREAKLKSRDGMVTK